MKIVRAVRTNATGSARMVVAWTENAYAIWATAETTARRRSISVPHSRVPTVGVVFRSLIVLSAFVSKDSVGWIAQTVVTVVSVEDV